MSAKTVTQFVLFHFRWAIVCFILLPVIFVLKCWSRFNILIHLFDRNKNRLYDHSNGVKNIQNQVRRWKQLNSNIPMCTGKPNWKSMTPSDMTYKKYFYNIHIDLPNILGINCDKKTVTVEPMVTFSDITSYLIPQGFTIPIVPELDDLTVGGIVMGCGLESSSHIYGLFHDTCVSYEMVLGDGALIHCSPNENEDLFYSIPGSYGTLGFLTAIEISLIPAKRYVEVEYLPVYSLDEAVEKFETQCKNREVDFLEGIMYSLNKGVLITGKTVDRPKFGRINRIGRWYKPWYFKYVEKCLKRGKFMEYVPLQHYYHRHSRSLFWEIQDIVQFGNNAFFRFFLGWLMPPSVALLKLTQTEVVKNLYMEHRVVLDLFTPIEYLKDLLFYSEHNFNVYPLWLCPFKLNDNPGMFRPKNDDTSLYVDIGIYGEPKSKHFHYIESVKSMEHQILQRDGYRMLYSGTSLSEPDFRKMYDHTLYDRLKLSLPYPTAFSYVYDKVNKAARI